jgi:hypothetical protein
MLLVLGLDRILSEPPDHEPNPCKMLARSNIISTDAVAMCIGIIDSTQKLATYAVALHMGIIEST